jgi:hypothetical protein
MKQLGFLRLLAVMASSSKFVKWSEVVSCESARGI